MAISAVRLVSHHRAKTCLTADPALARTLWCYANFYRHQTHENQMGQIQPKHWPHLAKSRTRQKATGHPEFIIVHERINLLEWQYNELFKELMHQHLPKLTGVPANAKSFAVVFL